MDAFGPWHLLIVAAIFVMLFGAKRLPDASKSMARSLKIFKTEMHSHDDSSHDDHPTAVSPQLPAPLPTAPVAPGAPAGAPVAVGQQTSGQ